MASFTIPSLIDLNYTQVKVIQEQINSLNISISSGKRQQDFKGYAKEQNVEALMLLQGKMNDLRNYSFSGNIATNELKTADSVIGRLQEIATSLTSLYIRRRSPDGNSIPMEQETDRALEQIASLLNTQENSNYIFAGSKTNIAPINSTIQEESNLDANSSATASYYQGDNTLSSIRITDTTTMTYGVTANDSAFQKLIGSVWLAKNGSEENSDTILSQAITMINESVSELTSVRAKVKNDLDSIDENNKSIQIFQNLFTEKQANIQNTDIVEASTKLAEYNAQLQASFMALARLGKVSLANYI